MCLLCETGGENLETQRCGGCDGSGTIDCYDCVFFGGSQACPEKGICNRGGVCDECEGTGELYINE